MWGSLQATYFAPLTLECEFTYPKARIHAQVNFILYGIFETIKLVIGSVTNMYSLVLEVKSIYALQIDQQLFF